MSLATLNGARVMRCRVCLPKHGVWWADVECGESDVLSAGTAVTLVVDDLTLKGTVITGGESDSRPRYRIAGGAGKWGKSIAGEAYTNDGGVKISTVVGDAARACGESVGTLPTTSIGPAFVRAAAPASHVLDAVAPKGWYVDELGVTQIGARPTVTYTGNAPRIRTDLARGTIVLAPPSIAALVPGAVVDGLEAVDVEHAIEDGKLRTTVWGARAGRTGDPVVGAIARVVEQLIAGHRFYAPWEYRVVQHSGERYDLQPVRSSSGMPDLEKVRIRPGVAGLRARPALGSLVIVSFVDGDPARPIVTAFDDPDSPGFASDDVVIGSVTATDPIVRKSDLQAAVDSIRSAHNLHVHESAAAGSPTTTPMTPMSAITATGSAVVKAV